MCEQAKIQALLNFHSHCCTVVLKGTNIYLMQEDVLRLKSLEALNISGSDYPEMSYRREQDLRFKKYLSSFLQGGSFSLHSKLLKRPDLMDSLDIKSLFILNALSYSIPLEEKNIFAFQRNELIANSLAKMLMDLYEKIYKQVRLPDELESNFRNIDFYKIANLLPSIIVYYTDFILLNKLEERYPEAFEILNNKNLFDNLFDNKLKPERLRLLAFYYRRIGDFIKADEALLEYRSEYLPDLSKKIKLIKIPNSISLAAPEVLHNLGDLYQEIKDIQHEVCEISGIYENSCLYYNCTECCKNDYPVLYYSEYKYLVKKLQEEGRDIEPYKAKAREIQAKHKELYGYELKLSNKLRPRKEDANPEDFKFECPFLGEHGCSIHSIRPVVCRTYGLSTSDNKNVQACNYYLKQYQYNSNYENTRYVYDVRPYVALMEASDKFQTKEDLGNSEKLCGTFIAWLCSDY